MPVSHGFFMKRSAILIGLLSVLYVVTLIVCPADNSYAINPEIGDSEMKKVYKPLNYNDMKAMWLSQYDLSGVYTDGGEQRSKDSFTQLICRIISNIKADGFNTVIVQVRPFADSMYPSAVYPPSAMVCGSAGTDFLYDPFEVIIKEAHKKKLSVQAWINPMRAMTDSEMEAVDEKYQIKRWYLDSATRGRYIVETGDRWYLNPAYSEVRSLITDGAAEILANYDIDGLHMDDYFYPTTDEYFDKPVFDEYVARGGTLQLSDWRRMQLNLLISSLYSTVKNTSPDTLFGISPAGVINTVYEKQYADIYTWCSSDGFIDYICPQIYFGLEHETCAFAKVAGDWSKIVGDGRVKLIIGMSFGKAKSKIDNYAGSGAAEWTLSNNILQCCLQTTLNICNCRGVAVFCYQYFHDPVSGDSVAETQKERDNFIPLLKCVTWNKS